MTELFAGRVGEFFVQVWRGFVRGRGGFLCAGAWGEVCGSVRMR